MDKNVQYILEVAKCGGITKAANNLYITPSALSKFCPGEGGRTECAVISQDRETFCADGGRRVLCGQM